MTSDETGGNRILGSLRSVHGDGVVRMEDRFDTDVDDLWSALTDPDRLAHWFGEVEGELFQGGEFRVRIALAGERRGQVDACEPPQRLVLTMRDPDPQPGQPEQTVIEAQLIAEGGQTRLVWEERGMPVKLLPAYGAGSKFTWSISPTTSTVASSAPSRTAGTSSSQPTKHWASASPLRTPVGSHLVRGPLLQACRDLVSPGPQKIAVVLSELLEVVLTLLAEGCELIDDLDLASSVDRVERDGDAARSVIGNDLGVGDSTSPFTVGH